MNNLHTYMDDIHFRKLYLHSCLAIFQTLPTTFLIEFLIWSNDRTKKINGNRIASLARLDGLFSLQAMLSIPL